MKKLHLVSIIIAGAVVFGLWLSSASAAVITTSRSASLNEPVNDDVFVSGRSVFINAPISGDIFAIGDSVTLRRKSSRSIFAAGNSVTVDDGVGYNGFFAGQDVTISGAIEHDVWVLAQSVVIEPDTVINGQLRIWASDTIINGQVKGKAYIDSYETHIAAKLDNDVWVRSTLLTFDKGEMAGNLRYETPHVISDFHGMEIRGTTHHVPQPRGLSLNTRIQNALYGALAALITGGLLILFARKKVDFVANDVLANWPATLAVGAVAFILTPLAGFALAMTIIGVPLALAILALYVVALYVAFVLSPLVIGRWGFKLARTSPKSIWHPYLLGLLLLGIVRVVTFIGPLVGVVVFVGVVIPVFGAILRWYRSVIHNG